MTPVQWAAREAWNEVASLQHEAAVLIGLRDICTRSAWIDDALRAYIRARDRAVQLSKLADHDGGGYNAWHAKGAS